MSPQRLQCPFVSLMKTYTNVRETKVYLSLRAVLVAHVGGGVLVDAVVCEMREHVPHLCALVAVLV